MSLGFSKIKSNSPLARLTNKHLDDEFLKKAKLISHYIEGFHLKNTITTNVDGRRATINGKDVINFGSANYLGLDQHVDVLKATEVGLKKWGNHSGCSRIFSSHENMVLLEEETAKLVGGEKVLICPNTAQTHQAVIPTLFSNSDSHIFIDRHAHNSMYQASLVAKAKGAKISSVDSNNLKELEEKLSTVSEDSKVLLIDGLYSMQGHLPDIPNLDLICKKTNTILYIDDAHGIGIYGENGGGVRELFDLSFENLIITGTLQKGLGCFGGFVAANASLIDLLRVSSKAYIFSGTLQPHTVDAAMAAIKVCKSETGKVLRSKLSQTSLYLRNELKKMGFTVGKGDSPIISVESGGDIKTLFAGRFLFDQGIFLNSVLFPAVPKNEGILRISLTTLHSEEDISKLLNSFASLKKYWKTWVNLKNMQYFEEILKTQVKKVMKYGTEKVNSI